MSERQNLPERVLVLYVPACEPQLKESASEQVWAQVFDAVQRAVPGATQLRPGWCAMRARGPTRYYGSEGEAAKAVLNCITRIDDGAAAIGATAGVACGSFTAQQAALAHEFDAGVWAPFSGVRIIKANTTAEFLASLSISRVVDEQLAEVLASLGVRTLGAFAALPEQAVLQRFGRAGALAHSRSRGLGEQGRAEVVTGEVPHDFSRSFEFEPPLDGIDQLAFACFVHAEAFVQNLTRHGLVCTELLVELLDDTGVRHERCWSHPANFTVADVVNRIRLQAATLPAASERGGAGVAAVRLFPARTARASAHEPGLWSNAPDERVHHQLTRVQSLLGHQGVGTEVLTGGRLSTDRQAMLPWGAAAASLAGSVQPRNGPWPGRLTGAVPNAVFEEPLPVTLIGATGNSLLIDNDDLLNEPPARFGAQQTALHAVQAWSAPWPLREKWWVDNARTIFRLQLVLETGEAWLLRFETDTGWSAEGRYC